MDVYGSGKAIGNHRQKRRFLAGTIVYNLWIFQPVTFENQRVTIKSKV
jgi:hypothetical protein